MHTMRTAVLGGVLASATALALAAPAQARPTTTAGTGSRAACPHTLAWPLTTKQGGARPSAVRGDLTGDGRPDLLARTTSGELRTFSNLHGVPCTRGSSRTIGLGWGKFTALVRSDFDGDRREDVIGRDAAGLLTFYAGRGDGTVRTGVRVKGTAGWNQFSKVVAPGDLNADGRADLLAVRPDGRLFFYAGTGRPGVRAGKVVATGWQRFSQVVPVGDLTGDGRPDVLGVDRATGNGLLYAGGSSTGKLRYVGQLGSGWGVYKQVVGVGDWNRDGHQDVMAVRKDGRVAAFSGRTGARPTVRYAGLTGSGWDRFTAIF